jgi:hypothetical protein
MPCKQPIENKEQVWRSDFNYGRLHAMQSQSDPNKIIFTAMLMIISYGGCARMGVGFTTTYAISDYHH